MEERTAALAASNEALQAEIAERKRAEESLREADRRKDAFLAMLAHELRNPLAPISNGLQILQMTPKDSQAAGKALGMIQRQVDHLTRILADLLDVSRIQGGKVVLHPERLDLSQLVRNTVEDHQLAFNKGGLSVQLEVPDVPAWVEGDSTRLTQILTHLLQNAIKYTNRGGLVCVRLEMDPVRPRALLSVKDTGMGIEPALLPYLFEAFAQGDRSLDRNKGGLGLGLALVKGLTELHGGEVRAASAGVGRGAEFVVRLPAQAEPAVRSCRPTEPRHAQGKLRILLVEDNLDTAESLRMLLELFGHEVAVEHSGPSGVRTAGTWKPDVVLCDIGLPGMDGYGVARTLRRNPVTAQVRMIAVTGYGGDEDRRKSLEAGFDLHVVKPVTPEGLQDLLSYS